MTKTNTKIIMEFIQDPDAREAFITGPAGSGKTTILKEITDKLVETHNIIVTAFTHKAIEVLRNKLSPHINISTLHSFLKKRPDINKEAKKLQSLTVNRKMGTPDKPAILIIDEFSFVGDKDYSDISDLIDDKTITKCNRCKETFEDEWICPLCGDDTEEIETIPGIKIIYVGDEYQLPPVRDEAAISPYGDYVLKLTEIHRSDSKLLPLQMKIRDNLDKGIYEIPEIPDEFITNSLLDSQLNKILCYTNERVQYYNFKIHGKTLPDKGDVIFSSSFNKELVVYGINKNPMVVTTPRKNIDIYTKYNPIEAMIKMGILFLDTNIGTIATVFGSKNYLDKKEELGIKLVKANQSKRDSSRQYRNYKTFHDYVVHSDFTNAITIHKSQGQEWEKVGVDLSDLNKCNDKILKLKLLYVSISRSQKILKILTKFY